MTDESMRHQRHVLCSVLEFEDGDLSVMELCRGTIEECRAVADRLPAVANSTGRKAVAAHLCAPTETDFDETMNQAQRAPQ